MRVDRVRPGPLTHLTLQTSGHLTLQTLVTHSLRSVHLTLQTSVTHSLHSVHLTLQTLVAHSLRSGNRKTEKRGWLRRSENVEIRLRAAVRLVSI